MKELMKGPNQRGRKDFENAISDDLEKQNFQNLPALCQPWWHFVEVGSSKFIKLAPLSDQGYKGSDNRTNIKNPKLSPA
jgi:hypothetical protein